MPNAPAASALQFELMIMFVQHQRGTRSGTLYTGPGDRQWPVPLLYLQHRRIGDNHPGMLRAIARSSVA
ncbi:hypothetical protein MJ585_09325 [Klebsiella pneumoniae]|nr:hypothetical protein MJ585_09325 [Klebsiella pneumoniae]